VTRHEWLCLRRRLSRVCTSPVAVCNLVAMVVVVALIVIAPKTSSAQSTSAPKAAGSQSRTRTVDVHLDSAVAHFNAGRYKRAAADYRRAFAADPRQPRCLYGAARAEHLAGDLAAARALYLTVLRKTAPSSRYHAKTLGRLAELEQQRRNIRRARHSASVADPPSSTTATTDGLTNSGIANVPPSPRAEPSPLATSLRIGSVVAGLSAVGLLTWAFADQADLDAANATRVDGKIVGVSHQEATRRQDSINARVIGGWALVAASAGAVAGSLLVIGSDRRTQSERATWRLSPGWLDGPRWRVHFVF